MFRLLRQMVAVVLVGGAMFVAPVGSSAEEPAPCAPGTYSATGSEPCLAAPTGMYVDVEGALAATACPPGTYQPDTGQASCILASAGSYVPGAGFSMQFPCMQGWFQASMGQAGCESAPPGSYVDVTGAVAAIPCSLGRYQPYSGMTMCVLAEPGSYVAVEGAVAAEPCPVGYYEPLAGASSCLAAQPGYFVAVTGAAAQAACPPGTTSGTAAVACTAGLVISGFRAPVDAAPTVNSANAGQTIPLKFTVTTAAGEPVTTLTSVTVTVTSLSCSAGVTADAIEEYAAGSSGLQNLGGGQYQFNWKTPKSYASSCKTLKLDLGDGVARTALFAFRK